MRSLPNVAIVRIAAVCSTVAATAFAGPGVPTASAHSPGHNGLPTAAAAAAGQSLSVSVGLTTSRTELAVGYVSVTNSYPVTNYHLDFGDGTSIDQAGPGFQHVYPASSVWKITATVTDSTGATATAIAYFDAVVPSTMTRVAGPTRYDTSTSTSRLSRVPAADPHTDSDSCSPQPRPRFRPADRAAPRRRNPLRDRLDGLPAPVGRGPSERGRAGARSP